jgi:hypothetical protein
LKKLRNRLATIVVLVVGLIILAALPTRAQTNIGLMFGPTAGNMTGSYIRASDGFELGLTISLTLDYQFDNRWAIATGVAWIQKGGKKIVLSSVADSTYDFQSQYIQIPLLVRAALPISGGEWYLAPFAGVALNLNGGCQYKHSEQFEYEEEGCNETTPGGSPETIELSIPLGANLWHEFEGGSRFIFEVRYELGLSDIFSTASKIGQSARNNLLTARMGFSLPLN